MYKMNGSYLIIVGSTHYCVENVDKFNTEWNTTVINTQVNVSCTGEYVGNVSRNCTGEGIWEEPDYSQCISKLTQYLLY